MARGVDRGARGGPRREGWTVARGVDRGARGGPRREGWTVARGVDRGARGGPWREGWTVARGVDRGARGGPWREGWTAARGVDRGARGGPRREGPGLWRSCPDIAAIDRVQSVSRMPQYSTLSIFSILGAGMTRSPPGAETRPHGRRHGPGCIHGHDFDRDHTGGRHRHPAARTCDGTRDGLEQLEPVRLQHRREPHQGDRRRHGEHRAARVRLHVRQHRRLLDGADPRRPGAAAPRPGPLPGRHRRHRRLRARPRAEARHLLLGGHRHLPGPAGQPRPRDRRRADVGVVGRGPAQVRQLQQPGPARRRAVQGDGRRVEGHRAGTSSTASATGATTRRGSSPRTSAAASGAPPATSAPAGAASPRCWTSRRAWRPSPARATTTTPTCSRSATLR